MTRGISSPTGGDVPAASAGPTGRRGLLTAFFSENRLSTTQRRVAEYLTEHPEEAPFLPSAELASRCGVSQPSVIRLAYAMGCAGYQDLQEQMRRILLPRTDGGDDGYNKYQQAVSAEMANLGTLKHLWQEADTLASAGAALSRSRPLLVMGLRASSPMAFYFSYFVAKIHPDIRLIDEAGSRGLERIVQGARDGASAVVAFFLPRYPRDAMPLLRRAHELLDDVVLVTDTASAPATPFATHLLAAPVGAQMVFDAQTAPMMIAVALLEAMADADRSAVADRLEEFERMAADEEFFISSSARVLGPE